MTPRAAALALLLLPAATLAEPQGGLLGRSAAPLAQPVTVSGWIERAGGHPSVVVSLRPEGEVRLVADPGIIVQATAPEGLDWLLPLPHHELRPGADYFEAAPQIRLPFAAEDGRPIALRIDYAYCYVDTICLFGEETLTLATRRP